MSGPLWLVNQNLRSMEYTSRPNWNGWDKITVSLTDLGYDGSDMGNKMNSYEIHISVAAINDPPILEVTGLSHADVLERGATGDNREVAIATYLYLGAEDTTSIITGLTIRDVDIPEPGDALNIPDGFSLIAGSSDEEGGISFVAMNPKMRLSLACTYGKIALGGGHAGLTADVGSLDNHAQLLVLEGSLSNFNDALVEGIVYMPHQDWHGVDLIEVKHTSLQPLSLSAAMDCKPQVRKALYITYPRHLK